MQLLSEKIDARIANLKLTPTSRFVLAQLLHAHTSARSLSRDKWDFAYEIQALRDMGIDRTDLRLLLCQGLVEHAVEKPCRQFQRRCFQQAPGLQLFAGSCFVLSDWGVLVARQASAVEHPASQPSSHSPTHAPHINHSPIWDSSRRELRLGEHVVKRFRQPAKNQETILAAFQEEGWPPRIDDPLSGRPDQSAPERLHEAVRKLNRQHNYLLRFFSDGVGQGVIWELRNTTDQEANRKRPI